jgi:hypothetical protein
LVELYKNQLMVLTNGVGEELDGFRLEVGVKG